MARSVPEAISAGIAALARMQGGDGSFPLLLGEGRRWFPCYPVFSTAYIMLGAGALLPADNITRAVAYIRGRRRSDGLWEYDPSRSNPPDADTTSCSLAALVLRGDGSDAAGGADLIRSFWRGGGGPFQTWKATTGPWSMPNTDDPVVNCNVLFALRLLRSPATADELPPVLRLLYRTNGRSQYYWSPATTAHAARRAGLAEKWFPPASIARPDPRDLIGAVQWLCAMPPQAALIEAVLAAQREDGSWPLWPWVGEGKPFWGGAAITTALALEALWRSARPPAA